jgi:ABC-type polysaccharide/polyol phosphate transport system ATPase subunit
MQPAIECSGVGVAYRLARVGQRSIKGLPSALLRARRRHEPLWALRDVSLTVERGEIVALVGANGAGKSTLLRLLAQVFRPTTGRVVVRGTTAPVIDLGTGLDLEATALDNVVLYGALLGGRPRALREGAEEVIGWAGLAAFADVPVGAFSTGMLARLAFAIATAGTPQVVLIDEVLAVGDHEFQQRSRARIDDLANSGCTVILVSHAVDPLDAASRGVWLDHGQVRADGGYREVLDAYLAAQTDAVAPAAP